MRRFKKIMAAVISGALIVGSVGVMPNVTAATEEVELLQNDFEGEDALTKGISSKTIATTTTADEEDGNTYLSLAAENSKAQNIIFDAGEAVTSGIIWIEVDLSRTNNSAPQRVDFWASANSDTGFSATTDTIIAYANGGSTATGICQPTIDGSSTSYTGNSLGVLSAGNWRTLSFKIDMTSKTYTAYYQGGSYTGTYGDSAFQYFKIRIQSHNGNAGRPLLLDDLSIYKEVYTPYFLQNDFEGTDALTKGISSNTIATTTTADEEDGNTYLSLAAENNKAQHIIFDAGEAVTSGIVWIEVDLSRTSNSAPQRVDFWASANSDTGFSATTDTIIAYANGGSTATGICQPTIDGSSTSYTGNSLGVLSTGNWRTLSFKIDMTSKTYTAYYLGSSYTGTYGDSAFQYFKIRIQNHNGNASRPLLLDNLKIYESEESPYFLQDDFEGEETKVNANSTSTTEVVTEESGNKALKILGTNSSATNTIFDIGETVTSGVVWIEVDVKRNGTDSAPQRMYFYGLDKDGTNTTLAYSSFSTSVKGLFASKEESEAAGENWGEISDAEWRTLSFKIDITSGTYTAYYQGKVRATGTYTDSAFQQFVIKFDGHSGDGSRPILIDNLKIYKERAKIAGTHLSLSGNIGVNYHMDLSMLSDKTGAYVKFELPDGTTEQVNLADVSTDSDTGYYIVSCEVTAKHMTGAIITRVYDGEGNPITGPANYSVYANANSIINDTTTYTEETIALAKALLNYGAYTQTYFEVSTDNLANQSLADGDKNVADVDTSVIEEQGAEYKSETNNISFYGASLVLKSETAVNYYFKIAEGFSIDDFTFWIGDTELEVKQSGDMYYVKKANINAVDLKNLYSVTVKKGDSEVIVVSYSALQYAYNVLNSTTDLTGDGEEKMNQLKNVVRALYKYQVAANAYKNSLSTSN